MTRGTALSGLTILGGIWIGTAPFWLGYAPTHGPAWTPVVALSVWLGAVIAVAGLVGLLGFWAGGLGELERQLRRRPLPPVNAAPQTPDPAEEPPARTRPRPEAGVVDPDADLQALLDRVLKDRSLAADKPS